MHKTKGDIYMDRRYLLLLVGAIAILGVVNATVFAYRWMTGTISIAPADQATGAACTGFYSAADQPGIGLPEYGTNYNAPTYGDNTITITPGNIVCTWDSYKLYESIEATFPVSVGSWYIQDFYAFGYKGTTGDPTVYVYFRVEDAATEVPGTYRLIIFDKDGNVAGTLNLAQLGAMTDAITLNPGDGLRLDLRIDADNPGTVTFKVGVYVTQEANEPPINPQP